MEPQAIHWLAQMLMNCCRLYTWSYDSNLNLIDTTCPEPDAIQVLFLMDSRRSNFAQSLPDAPTPLILTGEMELVWLGVPQFEGNELVRAYVIGPFFLDDISTRGIEAALVAHNISASLQRQVLDFVRRMPIISWSCAQEYAIMLYYCLTGESLNVSKLRYCQNRRITTGGNTIDSPQAHGTYAAEQEMLRMVREGDLNLQEYIGYIAVTGSMGQMSNGDPLRQMKNAGIVCATLFSRAAIEGGLSPEFSLTLSDIYMRAIEACHTISELTAIIPVMQQEYVQRVHRCRLSHYSKPVRQCLDYVELHLEKPFDLTELASSTGYTPDYLSRRFKKEIGRTVSQYLMEKRVERAAFLLASSQDSILHISQRLQFCSSSHFSARFHSRYGISPSSYRAAASYTSSIKTSSTPESREASP